MNNFIILGRKTFLTPKYVNIPIMADKKCLNKRSKALQKAKMCTSAKEEKLICSVS